MNWIMVASVALAVAWISASTLALYWWRRSVALERLARDAKAAVDESMARLGEVAAERDRVMAVAQREKKRADEQFAVIEDFEFEKRRIWEIYRDSVLGAGNCQDLLLGEMARILRVHNAMAKKHKFEPQEVSESLQKAVARFANVHRDEAAVKSRIADLKQKAQEEADRAPD